MTVLSELTQRLQEGSDLPEADCTAAAGLLPAAGIPAADKQAFLEALHAKGETVPEVTAFARVFRELAADPGLQDLAGEAIDIVGTGGSGSKGFNISSVTAILVAASGSRVLKHGNRAITSQSGSADFLGQLGIHMETDPEQLRSAVEELNFCFFFAPAFHPAFKEIMPVRKEMAAQGKRSIFNILGPLINPARPGYQLLGVFDPKWVDSLAGSLDRLGLKNGLSVSCELNGGGVMDELTTAGRNRVCGFGALTHLRETWTAQAFGLPEVAPDALKGGTAEENVELFRKMLEGRGPAGLIDSIVLNAAAAFLILGRVGSIEEGCALARETLLGGRAAAWLKRAHAFYAESPA